MAGGIDLIGTLALVAGILLLVVGVGAGVIAAVARGHGLASRLRQIGREYGRAGDDGESGAMATLHGAMAQGLASTVNALGNFNLISGRQRDQMEVMLLRAGIRRADGLRLLVTIKVVGILGGATIGLAVAALLDLPVQLYFVTAVFGFLVGSIGPERVLANRAKARQRRIAARLPDALDLLIIFANAGYGLDQAVKELSVEMIRSAPDLCDEFAVTSHELRLLADRDQALENLAARTDLAAIRFLVSALIQAQKYGTPLSQALRVQAAEMRNAQIMEIEEKASRMPVLITVPLILLILPALFLVVGTPAYIQVKNVWPQTSPQSGARP